jgi:hypothetical protein
MTLGHFSFGFLTAPAKLSTVDYLGLVFVLVILMMAWAHHVNDIS